MSKCNEVYNLALKDIVTSYRNFSISNISFKLTNGDLFGLIGRSGSGKSTLINTLVGFKEPDQGTIQVFKNDKEILLQEAIGFSPQENSLFPFLTVEENLITFAKLNKVDNFKINKQIDVILERLDLKNSRYKKIGNLSGGMQKRADLAVTLIHSPEIIVLDEPFNGLDISLQKFIWTFLKDLAKEGKMIIVSSHMLRDIDKNCNKIGLIEKGKFYNSEKVKNFLSKLGTDNLEEGMQKLFKRGKDD